MLLSCSNCNGCYNISACGKSFGSIEGLQYCINLVDLNLTGNDIEDISPLGSCRKLKELDLSRNEKLKDLSPISVCTQLTYLSLENCKGISDISPLRSLTKLKDLDLEKVCITSENSQAYMNTIKSLTNLTSLCLAWCDVKDEHTSMLNSLTKLTKLTIGGNYLSNPGFLEKHTNLTQLSLYGTDVGNSAVYSKLTNLKVFGVGGTCISDFSFINKMPNLTDDSIRWAEWSTDFRTNTNTKKEYVAGANEKTIRVKNPVKNESGVAVAPKTSSEYSYDKTTNEIVIPFNNNSDSVYVRYEFTMKTKTGKTLYAGHSMTVYINRKPGISGQPKGTTITEGGKLSLSVQGIGDRLKYQWYKDGKAISGATSSSYTKTGAKTTDSGKYYVIVTNSYGNVTSNTVTVTVNAKPTETTTQKPTQKPAETTTQKSTQKPSETTTQKSTSKTTEAVTGKTTENMTTTGGMSTATVEESTTTAEVTTTVEETNNTPLETSEEESISMDVPFAGETETTSRDTDADKETAETTADVSDDSSSNIIWIVLIVAVVASAAGAGFFVYKKKRAKNN